MAQKEDEERNLAKQREVEVNEIKEKLLDEVDKGRRKPGRPKDRERFKDRIQRAFDKLFRRKT